MIEITDLNMPCLRAYTNADRNVFIAESDTVIEKALDAGCEPVSFLGERGQAERIAPRAGNAPVYYADRALLEKLTGYHLTRGLMCAMRRPAARTVDECCAGRRIAYLENVADPSNVGAIFRCAAALGFDGIILNDRCADPLYRKAVRVSMGTVFALPWTRGTVRDIMDRGYVTVAMALTDDSVSIDDPSVYRHEKLAVVLGNEGAGLMPETIAACDIAARIPMHNGVDSLNVAAAAAIAFWQAMQK